MLETKFSSVVKAGRSTSDEAIVFNTYVPQDIKLQKSAAQTMHDEITKLKSSQIDMTNFDLSSSISTTNNLPWQFICSCT